MKYSLSFLFVFSGALNASDNLALVKKTIVKHDVSKLKELLETGKNTFEIIEDVKQEKEDLLKLAEETKAVQELKETLGEKKYTKLKRIGFGLGCLTYSGAKLILATAFQSDDIENNQDTGFFTYDRITDFGIGITGLSYLYWGITGKNPHDKVENTLEIIRILQQLPGAQE